MADAIKIQIPDTYAPITEDDVRKAKRWTLLRGDNASILSSLIEARLQDAVKELTSIAYRYNCGAEEWRFSQDENLREEVAAVMSELEDDIMELVEQYSLNESDDRGKRSTLLPWLAALSSKGAKDLASTLHQRLRQFLYDTEAQIAAMKLAGYKQTKALTRILSTMHAVYSSPEVQAAYRKPSAAMYIRSKGVHYGNVGLSSSGANNVESFGYQTATLGWERSLYMEYVNSGAVGFYVLRGSMYHCDDCQEKVGFHKIEDSDAMPPRHAHCQCYTIPVYGKEL